MSASTITLAQVDGLFRDLTALEVQKDQLAESMKNLNKQIAGLEAKISEVLISLERDEYESPLGKASFIEEFQVKQPADENKHLLWDWMKAKGIFERYAQVHARSLQTLFRAERNIAIENGEDPVTFALPGMEPATIFRRLKFKPKAQE